MLASAGPLRLHRGLRAVRAALELSLATGAQEGSRPAERRPRQALPERQGVRIPAGPGTRFNAVVRFHGIDMRILQSKKTCAKVA